MHRDWDLVRRILLALEEKALPYTMMHASEFKDADEIGVSYHIKMLANAALIEATDISSMGKPMVWAATSLTWDGHEFLDSIRSQSMWQKVQAKAREKGLDLTLDIIIKIAKQLADAML